MLWRAAIKLFAGDGTPAEPARSRTEVNARAEQLLDRYGNSLLRYAYSFTIWRTPRRSCRIRSFSF